MDIPRGEEILRLIGLLPELLLEGAYREFDAAKSLVEDEIDTSTLPLELKHDLNRILDAAVSARQHDDINYAVDLIFEAKGTLESYMLRSYLEGGTPGVWEPEDATFITIEQFKAGPNARAHAILLRRLRSLIGIGRAGSQQLFRATVKMISHDIKNLVGALEPGARPVIELLLSSADKAAEYGDMSAATAKIEDAMRYAAGNSGNKPVPWLEGERQVVDGQAPMSGVGPGRLSDPLYVISDLDAVPPELLTELIAALDELHRAHGGGGLRILRSHTGSEAMEGAAV